MQTNELDEHRQGWMQEGGYNIKVNNTDQIWTDSETCNDWQITVNSQQRDLDSNIAWYESKPIPKPSKHKEQPMEILYNVIVVSKDREILLEKKVVAVDEDEAKFSVDIHAVLKATKLRTKDVTILVQEIGEVKVRKEVQKVKMVDKEEE